MKILYGMQTPDEGTIASTAKPVTFRSPTDAIEAGIGMVHQHFMLADNLTVIENIILGYEPRKAVPAQLPGRHRRRPRPHPRAGDRYGLAVDPDELVETLGVGERQRVEILKVLYRGATTLILDEPTAVLVPQEVDELFETSPSSSARASRSSSSRTSSTRCWPSPTTSPSSAPAPPSPPASPPRSPPASSPSSWSAASCPRPRPASPPSPTRSSSPSSGLDHRPTPGGRPPLDDVSLDDPPGRDRGHRRRRGQRPDRADRRASWA